MHFQQAVFLITVRIISRVCAVVNPNFVTFIVTTPARPNLNPLAPPSNFHPVTSCNCTSVSFNPVCGVDSRTYANTCEINCARVYVASFGQCNTGTTGGVRASGCSCDNVRYNPVCGVDGKTYGSLCEIICANVGLSSYSPCQSTSNSRLIQILSNSCLCQSKVDPVCGVDGITYDNACLARCFHIPISRLGRCSPTVNFNAARLVTNCTCGAILHPVCGSDGITYDNNCLANCAGVKVSHEGLCGSASKPCACPMTYDPVCGFDCKQYANSCQARCVGTGIRSTGICNCSK